MNFNPQLHLTEIKEHYLNDLKTAYLASRQATYDNYDNSQFYNELMKECILNPSIHEIVRTYLSKFQIPGVQIIFGSDPKKRMEENLKKIEPDEMMSQEDLERDAEQIDQVIEDYKKEEISCVVMNYLIGAVEVGVHEREMKYYYAPTEIRVSERLFVYWASRHFYKMLHPLNDHYLKMAVVYQFSFFEACLKDMLQLVVDHTDHMDFLRWGGEMNLLHRIFLRMNINLEDFPKWELLKKLYTKRVVFIHCSGILDKNTVNNLDLDEKLIGEPLKVDLYDLMTQHETLKEFLQWIPERIIPLFN
ncbi:MAG: hypothetical protein JW776_16850 [Candidatus Lokiarchaeota archaeon]|nr:hypothetical protein [Candidatus Lokiarchaeota archaeon]